MSLIKGMINHSVVMASISDIKCNWSPIVDDLIIGQANIFKFFCKAINFDCLLFASI